MDYMDIFPAYESYLRDESGLAGQAEKICFPDAPEQVPELIRLARQAGKQLTIQGARTGLAGGAVPDGDWVLNLSHLDHMEKIRESRVRVQAGVTLEALQKAAGKQNLRFAPNPTEESASLGGLFAVNGAGPNALRYGRTGDQVLGLQWVTPEGELWEIQRGQYVSQNGKLSLPDGKTVDAESGRDLLDLLSGSEGKLGCALSLELKLQPIPKEQWGILFFFPKRESALQFAEALREKRKAGALPALSAGEYYNQRTLALLKENNSHPLLKAIPALPEGAEAAVYCELEAEEDCEEGLMVLLDLFDSCGGRGEDSWAENGPAGVRKLRCLRHAIPTLLSERNEKWEGDFSGPQALGCSWAENLEALAGSISAAVYGHILENGLRIALLPENGEEKGHADEALKEIYSFAVRNGGSIRGEYGMGRVKAKWCRESL